MYATIQDGLEQLKGSFPNLDAYVLRFDLEFLTLLLHPDSYKLIILNLTKHLPSNVTVDKVEFDFSEAPARANLTVQLKTRNDDGTVEFLPMNFLKIPLKMYQIKAIVN
jgi:hypothetical protein